MVDYMWGGFSGPIAGYL